MIYYPYDYDMMKTAEEHRKRIIREMEDANADYELIKLVLGRTASWIGKRLVNLGERLEVQPERRGLPQS